MGDFVYQLDLLRALEYTFLSQTENDVNFLSLNWHFFPPFFSTSLLCGPHHVELPSVGIFQKSFSLIH